MDAALIVISVFKLLPPALPRRVVHKWSNNAAEEPPGEINSIAEDESWCGQRAAGEGPLLPPKGNAHWTQTDLSDMSSTRPCCLTAT